MSGTLALASAIAGFDRADLARLVHARKPLAASNIADPIGLAAELLRAESISRALAPLGREALRVLLTHDWQTSIRITQRLSQLGLIGLESPGTQPQSAASPHLAALPEVDAVLRGALVTAGVQPDDLAAPVAPSSTPPPSSTDQTWFTPALTSVGEAAECLRALQQSGLRLNRNGSVGVAATRELAARTSISVESVAHALRQLKRARLTVDTASHQLVASATADNWLALPHPARWRSLAESFIARFPSPLRDSLEQAAQHSETLGHNLGRACQLLHGEFPLLPTAEARAAREYIADAEQLGCTVQGVLTPIAQRLLTGNPVATSEIDAQLPGAVAGVYLQPDLTVLAPGPLNPAAEAALASLTAPEQIGPASMRRITEASLAAAFERGISPASARKTFTELSLTGLPQPLDYLLTSVAAHLGRIVVDEHRDAPWRSRIMVSDSALAETVLVDRQLQHLQLNQSPEARPVSQPNSSVALFSRMRPEHVVSAFSEARYHASLATAEPAVRVEATAPADPEQAPQADAQDPLQAMIERVYTAARTEPAAAAFTRRLELAIRDRAPVQVTAEARGQRRTFTLTPVALTDGRLRATDVEAGVERTLPVSMIVAVDSA